MRARNLIIGSLLLACVGLGCASVPAPAPLCLSPDRIQETAFGVWTELQTTAGSNATAVDATAKALGSGAWVRGELIAVEEDSVYVLTPARLVGVSKADIASARLYTFAPNTASLALWTVLGSLSTASHGFLLPLSLPVWIIAGTAMTVSESHAPEVKVPGESWGNVRVFARFPQGLPPGLDRSALEYVAGAQRR